MIVTTFSSGIPCTFYGFISADAVVDFGPVEALVYWDRRTWRIHAPGILWPLRPTDRLLGLARSAVHAVARTLRNQLGYIGAFGTDGVLTEDGYAIHEINPRVCAGFSLLDQLLSEAAPLAAFDLALRERPEASKLLATSLMTVPNGLDHRAMPAYRLWEEADDHAPPPWEPAAQAQWAQRIRKKASSSRQPILGLAL